MSQASPTFLVVNGWAIFAHPLFLDQLELLAQQVEAFRQTDPAGFVKKNATKRLAAIAKLAFEVIPQDPTRAEYRQGNTLGEDHRHWFRAKFSTIPTFFPAPRPEQGDRLCMGKRRGHQTRL